MKISLNTKDKEINLLHVPIVEKVSIFIGLEKSALESRAIMIA